jgi:hypothetical protein
MTIAAVQATSTGTFGTAVTVSNTVLFNVAEYDQPTVTVTNVKLGTTTVTGTTQLAFPQTAGAGLGQGICVVLIPNVQVSGQTVVNYTCSTADVIGVYAEEVSGLGSNPTLDQSITNIGTNGNIASGTTSATTKAAEFVWAAAATFNGSTSSPTGSTWVSTIGLASDHLSIGYIIQSTVGQTYTWNQVVGGTGGWAVAIVTLSSGLDALIGTASNTSSASGNTTFDPEVLAGTAHNTSAASGATSQGNAVVGTAPNTSIATGSLTLLAVLTGAASDTSSATGAFTPQVLAGTASDVSAASGALILVPGLSGTALDVSSTTASITLLETFSGTASNTSTTISDLIIGGTDDLAATAPSISVASVTFAFNSALVGTAPNVSRASAFLQMSSGPRHPKALGGTVFNADDIAGNVAEVVINGTLTIKVINGTITRVTNVYNGSVVGWTMQEIDITLAEFNDETLDLTLTAAGGGALNITGYEIDMFLKTVAGSPDGDAVKLSTVTGEITITNPTGGLATAAIPAVDLGATASYGFYRVDAVDTGGYRNTAIFGKVSITPL